MKKILCAMLGIIGMFITPAYALPAGYTELEYIKSTGTQYIDDIIKPNQRYSFEIKYKHTVSEGYQPLFALYDGTSGYSYGFMEGSAEKGNYAYSGNSETFTLAYDTSTIYTLYYDGINKKVFRNGTEIVDFSDTTGFSGTTGVAPRLFQIRNGEHYSSTFSYSFKGYAYSFKVYDDNNNLVRNMIPAKRNSDNAIGMYDTVGGRFYENAGSGSFIAGPVAEIKVATTKYVETQFSDLGTRLAAAVATVNTVVTQTIAQAGSIATLQSGKQTRPDETCPAGKKCLLVEGTDGQPHWYEIFDPINRWLEAFFKTNPNGQLVDGGADFRRWQGNPDFRETYIDGSTSVYARQWTAASPARSIGGLYQTLPAGDIENAGTWAVEFDGTEGDGVNAGAVYGIAKCTSVVGTIATKLTSAQESAFYTLPAPVGQTDNANYPRENFKNCWCKMTAVGVPGADGTAANGSVYPVNASSSAWVFSPTFGSAAACAGNCAYDCAYRVRANADFRTAVFGLD